MILVTGASGRLGRAVVQELGTLDVPVTAGTRRPEPGSGHRVVDFDRPDTLDLTGVRTLVLVSAGYAEDDEVIARHDAVIAAAERDGVTHVVYTGLISAGDLTAIALPHRRTEDRLRRSSLNWTFLRNGLYAELLGMILRPTGGVLPSPLGDGGSAVVARADLARAAALVAAEPDRHVGLSHELTGPFPVTAAEVAARLGVPVRDVSLGELRASLAAVPGLRPFEPERLLSICSVVRAGYLGEVRPDLEKLLGRPARDPMPIVLGDRA